MTEKEREYIRIYCCGDCIYYKRHKCVLGASDEGTGRENFYRDCPFPIYKEKGAQKEELGKWIFHEDFNDSIKYGCNQCGNLTNIPSNFCPTCGKRMKKYLKGAKK